MTRKDFMDILNWVILGMAFFLIYDQWGYLMVLSILGSLSMILIALYVLSFGPTGFFTQLPNNTWLRVKRGKSFVTYYVNGVNLAIDDKGKSWFDEGQYQRELRSGPLGLIFRLFGMVYTGIPGIGGVTGMTIPESELKFTQHEDGSVTTETVTTTTYYPMSIPIFIRRGISFGGIPLKDKNLMDFGIATTLRISNMDDFGTKLAGEGVFIAMKGSLESALRQEVDDMDLDQVQRIHTEFSARERNENADNVANRIIETTNDNMERYGYGLTLHDIDMPMINPGDRAFAAAARLTGLNEQKAAAQKVLYDNEAYGIRVKGNAIAEARKLLIDASGDPSMALFAEGMGSIKPGVTLVLGNGGAMPTIPLSKTKTDEPQ